MRGSKTATGSVAARSGSVQDFIHSTSALFTASGRSSVEPCPHSGTTTSRAFGMAAAISRDASGGVSGSLSPTSTRVGTEMAGRPGREFGPGDDRLALARETVGADRDRHAQIDRAQRRVGAPRWVQDPGESLLDQRREVAIARMGEERPPLGRLLRRIGARGGADERELAHPLGGPPHDLEADVAAHRDSREREARRGVRKDLLGHLRNRASLGGGEGHGPVRPERDGLRGEYLRGAKQAGHKNNRRHP